LEMLYRGFYHFSRAVSLGLASDPVTYFADPTTPFQGSNSTFHPG
jgi:hypothetical protein